MRSPERRYLLLLLGVFAAYVVSGKLGLAVATVHVSATAVLPPTGIAIAAGLIFGRRIWPAVLAGAFVVNVTTAGDVASSLGIAAGNTLEAIVAVSLVDRFANGRQAFLHVRTVGVFWLVTIVATSVSASIGVSTLLVTGLASSSDAAKIWLTWWLGDLGGAMVVAPLLLLWTMRVPALRDGGSKLELAALTAAVAASGAFVFTPLSPLAAAHQPIQFLVTPVFAWPVIRFGPRVTATTSAAFAAMAVWGALEHVGPFGRTPEFELALVQAFMVIAAVTALGVAAAVLERQEALEALRETEERLRLAEERKVAARDEFLTVAAHELKTPLTSLQLASGFVVRELDRGRELDTRTLRATAAALGSQTRRLGMLVDQLLDTVRVQADRMDLSISEQDIAEIASRVAHEIQATTAGHEIRVDADGPVRAAVDPVRIEQVIRNLLDNAIKFSPGGDVAVGVAASNGQVTLDVRDHGPGIPPESRERIFDRFYQARADSGGRGLGLGLYVSRHIVELHGGTIAAEFPADGGTRILVRLPVRVAAGRGSEGALR